MTSIRESSMGITVLIVEDDQAIAELLAQVLTYATPYDILEVPDASQALAVVTFRTPSLFILDYQLPDMSGLELSDHLHRMEELETVPTVLMSANLPSRQAMWQRHIVPLRKPFEIADLLQTVETLLPPQDESLARA